MISSSVSTLWNSVNETAPRTGTTIKATDRCSKTSAAARQWRSCRRAAPMRRWQRRVCNAVKLTHQVDR
jgi:hypothetical protein